MPRTLCEVCGRPSAVCLCPYLVSLKTSTRVIILQHPSEQKQSLATVPIIQQCLQGVEVWHGEDFSQDVRTQALISQASSVWVLYPSKQAQSWCPSDTARPNVNTLIIIDGTWRKAKRIWHLNPWLGQFNQALLCEFPTTQYRIRSSHVANGLSTLETVSHSLNWLHQTDEFTALQKPFDAMIDMQIEKMGIDVFNAHYNKEMD
ncbi:tRNA-uridine aminocarboxypropyltransferase [Bermanella sp. R86510]|uniref:tRNA-uridine aminocarboxypropyltransferase n=1 Tax=unclassified Bermanella TaxID=2627862 RepID=UPI0037CCAF83